MHYNYCTLFDSNYIDKGIVLIESLEKKAMNYTIYIFAFDKKCASILNDCHFNNVEIIDESELEKRYPNLAALRNERTNAEFCWTCTPYIIEYVLLVYENENCTYIDTDMLFWSDPAILVNEMYADNKSVLITPHFFENSIKAKLLRQMCGNYCVEFNSFVNNTDGLEVLNWWKESCTKECSVNGRGNTYGDQKYLDEFNKLFDCVHELQNLGGGMAPWNLMKYKHTKMDDNRIFFIDKHDDKEYELVFYHFQGCSIDDKIIDMNYHTWCGNRADKALADMIYGIYIKKILAAKELLDREFKTDETNIIKNISASKKVNIIQYSLRRSLFQHGVTICTIPMMRYRKFDFVSRI